MYKLTITWELGEDDEPGIRTMADILMRECHQYGSLVPEASLTRHGDRSGANLLVKTPDGRHYVNHKVKLTDIPGLEWGKDDSDEL